MYSTMNKTIGCFVFLLVFFYSESAPTSSSPESTSCAEEKLEKVGDCVKDLVSTVEKINNWIDKEYRFDQGEKDEFRQKCQETQECFQSVKSACPDFPDRVSEELDIMCSRFNFIIDKFTDCAPKLNNLTEIACVNELFGASSLKVSSREMCRKLAKNRKCVRKEVESACGKKMGDVMEENFNEELKLHNC